VFDELGVGDVLMVTRLDRLCPHPTSSRPAGYIVSCQSVPTVKNSR